MTEGPQAPDGSDREDLDALFKQLEAGDTETFERLVPQVYGELKKLARHHLRREAPGHTLQTTALVNEAYARLARERQIRAANRTEFFGIASHAMRRILVDYARKRKSLKRGGDAERVSLDSFEEGLGEELADELLVLDRALDRLKGLSPRTALVVQHRFFGGLTLAQTAELLQVSSKTVARDWETARAWLRREVTAGLTLLRGL